MRVILIVLMATTVTIAMSVTSIPDTCQREGL